MSAPIVQYVIVRSDLLHSLKWPTGALLAQACHACSAALHIFKDDDNTKAYFADLDNMHKVVLEANGEEALKALATKLEENKVDHKLWIEQPENIPTCLATKPYPKSEIQSNFKKFKLFK